MVYKGYSQHPKYKGGNLVDKVVVNDQFPSLVAIIYIQWIGAIMENLLKMDENWGYPHTVEALYQL